MTLEIPVKQLLADPPLFAQRAGATLDRCRSIYSNRGDQYGDTWKDCQWLKLRAILFQMFGLKPSISQLRAMALASLADVKYQRNQGGYADDHIIDGINYDAALAEEMRLIYSDAGKAKILGTVRFNGASKDQIRWGSCDDPNPLLTVGQIYDVTDIEVHSWHTKIQVLGVKGKFNSASFDWADEAPLQKAMKEYRKLDEPVSVRINGEWTGGI